MRKLLAKLNLDAAEYDDKAEGLYIPFGMAIGELKMKAYLYIPCGKSFHKTFLYALKEEVRKDDRKG